MKRVINFLIVVLLFAGSYATAFDGNRKGFVAGGGLGFGFVSDVEPELISTKSPGWAVNLYFGYAWDEKNVILIERNVTAFEEKRNTISNNRKLLSRQAIDAIVWYHYWGPKGRSIFTAVGIGKYTYNVNVNNDKNDKHGFLVGVGYEFLRHWQAGLYLTKGKTKSTVEINHTTVSLIIGGVAF